ncbi:ribbon-helix-helix domain-containing protein [Haloarcula nitratireducens]|uniref:Ribbon-helix-helix domain-containing protein n=1 Tax=Haloarcula nitratireducens TaxID=2487749 RepID=A0AAW4PJA6_9EURY|nr:ribbon-helix-helix domain-containing protein [Halomicroarcula nitratireducens]MBX0297648.1 ribbon-helix-helix domain-containing protein [Halomicroarcula nitratireducens]
MSDADTAGTEDGPETVQINLRLSKAFLEDIDATWQEEGFNSRSEFLRYAARDAVKHPAFSREGWKQIAATEHDLRSGDAELVSREEVVEMMDRDEDDE